MPQENRYQRMYPVSWDQLHRDCKALAWRLVSLGPWKGIYAIAKGGLIPAAIIARELDVRLIDTVCVASYDWQTQGDKVSVLKGVAGDGEGWLLIDDLVDTFITEVSQDTWILFPWDSEPQFIQPIAKATRNSEK